MAKKKTVKSASAEVDKNSLGYKIGAVLSFVFLASIVAVFVAVAIKAVQSVL